MTGNCCVKNLLKIYRQSQTTERIIEIIIRYDQRCDYTAKQKGILKADILEIFDESVKKYQNKIETTNSSEQK